MQKAQLEYIDNEAREWFTLMQSGSTTELQRVQLQQWLDADNAHKHAYRQYEIIWKDLGLLAASEEAKALKKSVKPNLIEQLLKGIKQFINNLFPDGLSPAIKTHLTISACASTALIAMLIITLRPGVTPDTIKVTQYATTTAEIKQIKLEDGSQITLGAKSEIKAWVTQTERHVALVNGQAFFVVAKDPQHPFFVDSGNTLIRVVGTQFDVRKGAEETRVAVLEGIVNVSSVQKPAIKTAQASPTNVILTAGQQVTHSNNGSFDMIDEISSAELEAWRHGRLIYRKANLADVIADANRYASNPILLSTKNLGNLKVTAAISTDQIDSLADMLSKSLPINAHRDANRSIIITPRDENEIQQNLAR